MPWTDDDQRSAEHAILDDLGQRLELIGIDGEVAPGIPVVDDNSRVVAALAVENVGNRRHPQGPLLDGDRLRRRLISGRFDRWSTLVWRATLAEQVARSIARRARFGAGIIPPGNRAARRAAAKLARKAAR